MTGPNAGGLGRVFDEVPELYDRTRPAYPDALFADLTELTGLGQRSRVLEVGCGTGQATRSLAPLAGQVTAVEPGDGLAALARQRLAAFSHVRWYPTVLWFDGAGFADQLRTRLGDRVPRRYLSMLRAGQRAC